MNTWRSVPATASSPMPTALAQLGRTAAPVPLADAVALSGFLDLVPDPRGVRGRRYRLSALVATSAASVLAAARSLTAITECISDVPAWACRVLGSPQIRSPAPCPSRTPTPCAVWSQPREKTPAAPTAPAGSPARWSTPATRWPAARSSG
ncbi:transposase family protein [Streptomyces murinus]|uniref:transposase family protein n=1 Tax=Streptomyces murinus TaxID=33900 RepID=UPI003F4771BD